MTTDERLKKLEKTVYGNGDEGLTTKIALIQQKITDVPKPRQLKVSAFLGGIAAVFMLGFGVLLVKLIKTTV